MKNSMIRRFENGQIEKVILGCILQKGELYEKVNGDITINDFTILGHKVVFKIFGKLYKAKTEIDMATVGDYGLKNNLGVSLESLTSFINSVPNIEALDQYLKLLKSYTYDRVILQAIEQYRKNEITADKLQSIIGETKPPDEVKKETNENIILKTLEEIGTDFKFPDNFEDLNQITGGFDRGDLIIIGGYPSNGKSSLCTDLTVGFCGLGHKMLVITLEMSVKANMRRILANTQQINTMRFRHGTLNDLDRDKIKAMIPIINDTWEYTCVRAYTMPDIMRAVSEYNPDIFVIDYLQNISDLENLSEYARLTKFTLQIQQMARSRNVPAFLLSQFHRPQEGKVRQPRNNDFRGSGSIEERAEIILLIYWERKLKLESLSRGDGESPEYMILDVTKNKDGETGRVEMEFYPEYHRWGRWIEQLSGRRVIKYAKAEEQSRQDFKERYGGR